MVGLTLLEWLDELESEPQGTDLLDLNNLLIRAGFQRYQYGDTYVYEHADWGLIYTLSARRNYVPVSYLLSIVRAIRRHIN